MAKTTSGRANTREQLLAEHAAARHRRDAAALGSTDFRKAAEEIARIEVEIARIEVERASTPPRS
jgi:hypothetical protein